MPRKMTAALRTQITCLLLGLTLSAQAGERVVATQHDTAIGNCRPANIPVCTVQLNRPAPPGNLKAASPLRQSIVAAAIGELGLVSVLRATDCRKQGWSRLTEYYRVAYQSQLSADELQTLKRPKINPDDVIKVNDWCGIFAIWAVKAGAQNLANEKAGVCDAPLGPLTSPSAYLAYMNLIHWSDRPEGLPLQRGTRNMRAGDVVVFSGELNHHAVVERIVNGRVHTIDANMECGMTIRKDRDLTEVNGYYQVE